MNTPKRILLIADNPYMGGVTSHVVSIFSAMRGGRFEFWTACFPGRNEDTALLDAAEGLGITVHVFPMRHGFDITVLAAFQRFVADHKIHLIHTHGYRGNLIAALARTSRPVVSTCHGEIVAPAWRTRLWEWLSLRAMRRHNKVVACSDYVRRRLIRKGLAADRVVTVYNCCGRPDDADAPGVPGGMAHGGVGFIVLYVGRLVEGKGLDVLVDSLIGAAGVLLVLVGEGPLRDALAGRARRVGVPVHFAGAVDDPSGYYLWSHVVVLASVMEAMPMVLIEAAAHGKPVVASRAGGISEIVADGETGILVESGDPAALRGALERLRNPALRAAMGERARARWRRMFSPEIMAARLSEVYDDVLG